MKPLLTGLFALALEVNAFATITDPSCKGVLHGTAVSEDGRPVAGIRLVLEPLGVDLGIFVPTTRTSEVGEYRFENVCAGRFTVLVDDERAGYPPSYLIEWMAKNPEVNLTSEHVEAELLVHVPAKAASLSVIARNSRTNVEVPSLQIMLKPAKFKMYDWITINHHSSEPLLIPADTDLLCRVVAAGYREWQGGKKRGKQIRLASERLLTLEVELEPLR